MAKPIAPKKPKWGNKKASYAGPGVEAKAKKSAGGNAFKQPQSEKMSALMPKAPKGGRR